MSRADAVVERRIAEIAAETNPLINMVRAWVVAEAKAGDMQMMDEVLGMIGARRSYGSPNMRWSSGRAAAQAAARAEYGCGCPQCVRKFEEMGV